MKVVAHVEKDPNCQKLLATRFTDAYLWDDITTATKDDLPGADILCAGWPCQDLSVAGQRAGLAGERSGLFYHVPRLADELGIALVVWENVIGLLSSDEGRDMLRVIAEFQRFGYSGVWRTFDAQYFGLAQRRRRVFGVFARSDIGIERCIQILSLREGMRGNPPPSRKAGQNVAACLSGSAPNRRNGGSNPTAGHFVEEVAGPLGGAAQSGGFRTTDLDNNGAYIPEIAGCIQERDHKGSDSDTKPGHLIPIVFDSHQAGADGGEIAPTIRSMSHDKSHMNGGCQLAVAFQPRIARNGRGQPSDLAPALSGATSGSTSDMRPCVAGPNAVRRLTLREYERLQGFQWRLPDGSWSEDWTAGFSDSVRYKMLGNAVPPL